MTNTCNSTLNRRNKDQMNWHKLLEVCRQQFLHSPVPLVLYNQSLLNKREIQDQSFSLQKWQREDICGVKRITAITINEIVVVQSKFTQDQEGLQDSLDIVEEMNASQKALWSGSAMVTRWSKPASRISKKVTMY